MVPGAWSLLESGAEPWVMQDWEGERSGRGGLTRSREERGGEIERLRGGRKTTRPSSGLPLLPDPVFPPTLGDLPLPLGR